MRMIGRLCNAYECRLNGKTCNGAGIATTAGWTVASPYSHASMPGDRTVRRAASRQRVQQEEAAKRMRQIQTEDAAETVLKSQRQEGGNTLYLVRWAHPYNHPSHDSWEPGQNLSTGLLRAFAGAWTRAPFARTLSPSSRGLQGCRAWTSSSLRRTSWHFTRTTTPGRRLKTS